MEITLHIGTEKTGTTSIQNFLSGCSDFLLDKNMAPACTLSPDFGKNSSFLVLASDQDPGPSLIRRRNTSFGKYRKEIKRQIRDSITKAERQNVNRIIFSSEHLSSRLVSSDCIHKLKTLFEARHKVQIICYLRRQDQMLLGCQAEGIKYGNPDLNMELPPLNSEEQNYGIIYYDYVKMLGLWEKVFAVKNIKVAAFQQSDLSGGNVVLDFCDRMLGLPPDPVTQNFVSSDLNSKANKRYSAEALYVLSRLNKITGSDPMVNRRLIAEVDQDSNSILIKPSVLQEFYESFAASNSEIARKYLQRNELFDPSVSHYEYLDFENPTRQVETLTHFMSRLTRLYS